MWGRGINSSTGVKSLCTSCAREEPRSLRPKNTPVRITGQQMPWHSFPFWTPSTSSESPNTGLSYSNRCIMQRPRSQELRPTWSLYLKSSEYNLVNRQILMHSDLSILWSAYSADLEYHSRVTTASEQSCLPRHGSNLLGTSDSTLVSLSGEVTRGSKVGPVG